MEITNGEITVEKELFEEMIDVLCESNNMGPVGMGYKSDKRIALIRKAQAAADVRAIGGDHHVAAPEQRDQFEGWRG